MTHIFPDFSSFLFPPPSRSLSSLFRSQMSSLIDKRWESIVRPQFDDLVRVLNPISFLDRLYREKLVDNEEYQLLLTISPSQGQSRKLLSEILPRKGPTSYNRFMKILRETEGQEHVVKALCEQGERLPGQLRDF